MNSLHLMKKRFVLYNSGNGAKSVRGVGAITTESKNVSFNPVLESICLITIRTSENINCHLMDNTVRISEERRIFY